ncbi:hypothetical protein OIU77_006135 [Salix suchowensis]|uniref:Uncharacterized protein n=1 Tax=Salix suchowensis TaxID=1278906 RepID=A0ABQ9ARU1_9ROSI|nr:hypothetical protein OIU77_006135 [Salix suchowensis]
MFNCVRQVEIEALAFLCICCLLCLFSSISGLISTEIRKGS